MSDPIRFPLLSDAELAWEIAELRARNKAILRLQTHSNADAIEWRSEPNPSPWSSVAASLTGAIGLREVAATMPDGEVKTDLGRHIDDLIARAIDGCGTRPPGPPWPHVDAVFYPPSWVYSIASELASEANGLPAGGVRDELIEVAASMLQRAFRTAQRGGPLPPDEEIDALTASVSGDQRCQALCDDFLAIMDRLPGATARERRVLLARLDANRHRRRDLQCKLCPAPQ